MEKSEYLNMFLLETDFWWYRVLHELTESCLAKHCTGERNTILDAGCGTGRMMEISRKYGTVSGIDFSADAVALARERGLRNVELGDLNDFPIRENTFDAIICLDVLYHSGIESDKDIVRKFHGGLKEDGILIINLPAFESLRRSHDEVVHTKRRYRKNEFVSLLKNTGFTVKLATYRMVLLYFVVLISKLLQGNKKPPEPGSDLKKLPGWLNKILLMYGRSENFLIRMGCSLPAGSSLFTIAQKNKTVDP